MNQQCINEPVSITSIGFRKNLITYPRRMEFRGQTYDFVDAGLHMLIHHGGLIAEILTMTDGIKNYSLRTDDRGGNWTLLSIAAQ